MQLPRRGSSQFRCLAFARWTSIKLKLTGMKLYASSSGFAGSVQSVPLLPFLSFPFLFFFYYFNSWPAGADGTRAHSHSDTHAHTFQTNRILISHASTRRPRKESRDPRNGTCVSEAEQARRGDQAQPSNTVNATKDGSHNKQHQQHQQQQQPTTTTKQQ